MSTQPVLARYSLKFNGGNVGLFTTEDGEWVKASDAETALAEMQRQGEDKLRGFILVYGDHTIRCDVMRGDACTCGFGEIRGKAEREAKVVGKILEGQ